MAYNLIPFLIYTKSLTTVTLTNKQTNRQTDKQTLPKTTSMADNKCCLRKQQAYILNVIGRNRVMWHAA